MDRIDTLVIGAGVIGLAVARALALQGREVIVAEAETSFGQHTSSRNSEVIHAGLYYPAGSLKARLCLAGREALYRYCAERAVPHRRLGKLIVATQPDDTARLESLAQAPQPTAWTICNGWNKPSSPRWSRNSPATPPCCRPPPASSIATP